MVAPDRLGDTMTDCRAAVFGATDYRDRSDVSSPSPPRSPNHRSTHLRVVARAPAFDSAAASRAPSSYVHDPVGVAMVQYMIDRRRANQRRIDRLRVKVSELNDRVKRGQDRYADLEREMSKRVQDWKDKYAHSREAMAKKKKTKGADADMKADATADANTGADVDSSKMSIADVDHLSATNKRRKRSQSPVSVTPPPIASPSPALGISHPITRATMSAGLGLMSLCSAVESVDCMEAIGDNDATAMQTD